MTYMLMKWSGILRPKKAISAGLVVLIISLEARIIHPSMLPLLADSRLS